LEKTEFNNFVHFRNWNFAWSPKNALQRSTTSMSLHFFKMKRTMAKSRC